MQITALYVPLCCAPLTQLVTSRTASHILPTTPLRTAKRDPLLPFYTPRLDLIMFPVKFRNSFFPCSRRTGAPCFNVNLSMNVSSLSLCRAPYALPPFTHRLRSPFPNQKLRTDGSFPYPSSFPFPSRLHLDL